MPVLAFLRRRIGWIAFLSITLVAPSCADEAPLVAAASNLKFALDEVAAGFERDTGKRVRVTYGSSGNFYRQIVQGAPFELFLSAEEAFVLQLADQGLTVDRGELYALGKIALLVPRSGALRPDPSLKDLAAALEDGRLTKFAIANPEHAPYGGAAREVLQHAGLWEKLQPRLVLGENVSQAAQFALSGSAQGGIVAYSLALAPGIARSSAHVPLPEDWHTPLRQRMVLMKGAAQTAREFYRYLQQPAARAILMRYGFALPGKGG